MSKHTMTATAANRVAKRLTKETVIHIGYKAVCDELRLEGFDNPKGVMQEFIWELYQNDKHYLAALVGMACARQARDGLMAARSMLRAFDSLRSVCGVEQTEDIH